MPEHEYKRQRLLSKGQSKPKTQQLEPHVCLAGICVKQVCVPVATRWSKPLDMCGAGSTGPLRERASGAGLLGSAVAAEVVSTVISSATSTCQAHSKVGS